MRVYQAVTELADDLDVLISRPVTADPSMVSQAPCVLVELPRYDGGSDETLCGGIVVEHKLVVIGMPGVQAELRPLSDLLDETLDAMTQLGLGWDQVQPVTYVPFGDNLTSQPSMAYEITFTKEED